MLCCINRGSDVSSRFHIKQRIFSVRLCASRFGHAARRAVQYCMLYIQQANPQTSLRLMDLCLCTDRFICHKIKTKLQHNKVQTAQDKTDESGSSHMGPQQIHNAAGILKDKYAYGKCIQEQKVNMHFFSPQADTYSWPAGVFSVLFRLCSICVLLRTCVVEESHVVLESCICGSLFLHKYGWELTAVPLWAVGSTDSSRQQHQQGLSSAGYRITKACVEYMCVSVGYNWRMGMCVCSPAATRCCQRPTHSLERASTHTVSMHK